MPESQSMLPARPSLEQLQKQAKELLRSCRAGDASAIERFGDGVGPAEANLADAQFVVAREHGFATWAKLKHHIESARPPGTEHYQRLAREVAAAYMSGDPESIREINWGYGTSFAHERDAEKMQKRLPSWFASAERTDELAFADAQNLVARSCGFENWKQFSESVNQPPADPRSAPLFISNRPPFYRIDWRENRLSVRGPRADEDWEAIARIIHEHGITKLSAGGMSDAGMRQVSRLDSITHLSISDSRELTDDGAQLLAGMPQLVELHMGGWTSGLTDRALEPLRHLPALRTFHSCWTQGITDEGLMNLSGCQDLEDVNLIGTHAGDGSLRALAGKPGLRYFRSGRGVTDGGLRLLHEFPVFKTWHGGEAELSLAGFEEGPNHLLMDGPFTDAGLELLAGLDGLYSLNLFWHSPNYTPSGLARLRALPHLAVLGCDGKQCGDEAMHQIAALPHLRKLLGQGAVATAAGFAALAESKSLEYFWGRECPNFTGEALEAFSSSPTLRGLAVTLKQAEDHLSALPRLPALRELLPMDLSDAGFRHVGQCRQLERLWCMYCRDTGDAATVHLAGLSHLRTYYAGMTKITDRSLEILSTLLELEKLEFWQCAGISDTGLARLATLPRLREIVWDDCAGVTSRALTLFPAQVRVGTVTG